MTITPLNAPVLLGRPARNAEVRAAARNLRGARVLVTGASGSIGTHLSHALAQAGVEALILLDHHEHSLYDLVRELEAIQPAPIYVLADIRNGPKMRRIFHQHRPTHVLHLAAYKHVPFGQLFPEETVSVNISATRLLLELSIESGVSRFVYPSSDKAVNPPSLYGATKRVSEVATQQLALTQHMPYCIVRYVNVLGTRGSVIETFSRQLDAGHGLTVTDASMTRYWMTMDEAVWLLLAAATQGLTADVLMLDDLNEITVLDMASRLSDLLGYGSKPEIRITGIRPGERLREELISAQEAFTSGPTVGISRVTHVRRDAQLAIAVPSFAESFDIPSEALTNQVMELARRLQ
ncbi:MAG: SDR family NAD(P)-dependent oxidoreductase [Chloroflexota bacterium]